MALLNYYLIRKRIFCYFPVVFLTLKIPRWPNQTVLTLNPVKFVGKIF